MTVLQCGVCGRQAAVANRGIVGAANPNDIVVLDQRFAVSSGFLDTYDENVPAKMWSLATAEEWPMPVECERCGAALHLQRDEALTVGTAKRIVVRP